MPTFRMTVAYDGSEFLGWQRQPGRRTIQGELEKIISQIVSQPIQCVGSGRTDAGVHALGQVVSFQAKTTIPCDLLCKAINSQLPDDLFVFEVQEAHPLFRALQDARRKRYRYVIEDGRVRDIFDRRYLWPMWQRLDVAAMQEAAKGLVGTHDFMTYQSRGSMRMTTVRTIHDLTVERRTEFRTERIFIEVEADGFLYNMVRNIAGTLAQVGLGKQPISWPLEIIAARDRRLAGETAPAQGLTLVYVVYDDLPNAEVNPDADEDE